VLVNDLGIKSIMLDTSFCIRLMDKSDPLHDNALEYFKYFLSNKISIHISTIVIAEYAVGDDPATLPLNNLQIESFDFEDASIAGNFHKIVKGNHANIENQYRRTITNDIKIIAQMYGKEIEAMISKDVKSNHSQKP